MSYVKVPESAVNTVRMLAVDAVEKATCGHPGTPMGVAEMSLTLWANFLRFNPKAPDWRGRDRFVLSAGHASMLLYSLLHLFDYDCTMDDLKNFRQYHSRTAGHPEYGYLPGIETTTGPLGQGVGNAVGLALGQAMLAGKFNEDGKLPAQGKVWCLAGDGCLMEGVASEAASLAGHMKLNNLILIYDQNKISIDGSTDLAFTEDVGKRFDAYGWQVLRVSAYDQDALCKAFETAQNSTDKPTFIMASSQIGKGAATMEGSHTTHGAALGAKEIAATKEKIGWPAEPFYVPEEARAWCKGIVAKKLEVHAAWVKENEAWKAAHPELAKEYEAHWAQHCDPAPLIAEAKAMAADKASTRKHSGKAIQALAKAAPYFMGGSADLAESNVSPIKSGGPVVKCNDGHFRGRNVHFGVREHGMGAILNGLALHGAWLPYGATFMQFADYMRPTIRLAALMKIKPVFLFTHDSILLGEDGPTHQPVEHLSALRLIPGLTVWRPADGLESCMAWAWTACEAKGPSAMAFSRQNVAILPFKADFDPKTVWKGGYVLVDEPAASVTLIATGSEVGTAIEAAALLAAKGVKARIVSMPSSCVFGRQDEAYCASVLGKLPRVVIEAGSTGLWPSVVGSDSLIIGVDTFGLSAPDKELAKHFGLTPPQIAERTEGWLQKKAVPT